MGIAASEPPLPATHTHTLPSGERIKLQGGWRVSMACIIPRDIKQD